MDAGWFLKGKIPSFEMDDNWGYTKIQETSRCARVGQTDWAKTRICIGIYGILWSRHLYLDGFIRSKLDKFRSGGASCTVVGFGCCFIFDGRSNHPAQRLSILVIWMCLPLAAVERGIHPAMGTGPTSSASGSHGPVLR